MSSGTKRRRAISINETTSTDIEDATNDNNDVTQKENNRSPLANIIEEVESTHSFLFTEAFNSKLFWLALCIVAMEITCLALALTNNWQSGRIPVNIDLSIRVAQYISILVSV